MGNICPTDKNGVPRTPSSFLRTSSTVSTLSNDLNEWFTPTPIDENIEPVMIQKIFTPTPMEETLMVRDILSVPLQRPSLCDTLCFDDESLLDFTSPRSHSSSIHPSRRALFNAHHEVATYSLDAVQTRRFNSRRASFNAPQEMTTHCPDAVQTRRFNSRRASFNAPQEVTTHRSDTMQTHARKLTLSDFDIIEQIDNHGKFSSGSVWKTRREGKTYSLMIQDHSFKRGEDKLNFIRSNIDQLVEIESKFLIQCKWYFETYDSFCVISDYCSLNLSQLQSSKHNRTFSETETEFYVMEILLGLNALHINLAYHRSLTPENVLIDANGHVVLTGYFFLDDELNPSSGNLVSSSRSTHQFESERTMEFQEYKSPEAVRAYLHNDDDLTFCFRVADYWSLGCLLYECLHGRCPFSFSEIDQTIFSVLRGIHHPLSEDLSLEASDFISQLLQPDPSHRLANMDSAQNHAFFRSFSWKQINERTTRAASQPIRTRTGTSLDKAKSS